MQDKITDDLVEYFESDHWNEFVDRHLANEEDEKWHAHLWMETCVHPESLKPIVEEYFHSRGRPLKREIDLMAASKGDFGAVHGIHPEGLPHFDFFIRFNPDVVLAPAPEEKGEEGQNALSWGKEYMDEFFTKFDFRPVGPTEEREIREYFTGRHWKENLALITDPDIIHVHCNVRINFDPKILELIARDVLADQGWTIDKSVQNVFNVNGTYKGKIVFLGRHPEQVYDICWEFDPDVVIERANEPWLKEDTPPGFDANLQSSYENLVQHNDFVKLDGEEINGVSAQL